jgi:hypothetical protein
VGKRKRSRGDGSEKGSSSAINSLAKLAELPKRTMMLVVGKRLAAAIQSTSTESNGYELMCQ